MHILIIPSEEFVPDYEPLAGIFQMDQAKILQNSGYKIGVLSVRLRFSLPMILRGVVNQVLFRTSGNATDDESFWGLWSLLFRKIFRPSDFVKQEVKDNITVYRTEGFYLFPPSEKWDYKWWLKAGKSGYKRYISEQDVPDIIYAHNASYGGMLAESLKYHYGVPYWLTEHSSYFSRGLVHQSLLPKSLKAYQRANQFFVVSDFLGKGLEQIFGKLNYKVLPNVVDPVFEKEPLSKVSHEDFLFLSIGNLMPLKGHELLIRAFHQVFQKEEKVRLEIVGEGEEEQRLKHLIIELSESRRISLKGRLNKEQIINKLRETDTLCLFSTYETFGVVVIEAMFRGVPVIATKCGGPEEIINVETGVLVENRNVDEIGSALASIRKNIESYDTDKIREYAIRNFGSEAFLKRIEIYRKEAYTFINKNI